VLTISPFSYSAKQRTEPAGF